MKKFKRNRRVRGENKQNTANIDQKSLWKEPKHKRKKENLCKYAVAYKEKERKKSSFV
mgnify:FL=1